MAIDAVTPDLIYPVLLLIGVFSLIAREENRLNLALIGLLFLPLAWLFTFQMYGNEYLFFCNADITAYKDNLPGFNLMISLFWFYVPIMSLLKIVYLNRPDDEIKADEDDIQI